ncbi:Lactose permease [Cyphellophora attinorum]|uniref:Lactose permease n=1 Tax=Cyphellophora attinorum TaxID=1664694 RepID=A0A0N0NPB1_9EURO|nr:Lactose permease [Phialophora attinorum]KPI42518.1 Lactose permease [Phialophora attinorum]
MSGLMAKRPAASNTALATAEAPEIPYVDWKKSPGLRKLYFYAAVICVASATTGYDELKFNTMQILPAWRDQFDDPHGSSLGRLSAMYSIGSIASLPIAPFVSDRFGRKMSIIIGCVIMVIAAAVQTSATAQPQFEGGRFFMGFGNSLAQLSSPLLLAEICHPQHRARVTAIYNYRADEALNMLGKYHADGNVHDPTVQFEYAEIKETIRLEFLYRKSSRYVDFLKTKGNRYRLAIIVSLGLFSQWSGNGILSYYSNIIYDSVGITSTTSKLGLDAGNKVMSLLVSITCALLVDRVGRRPLFIAATAGMFLFFLALTITGSQYSRNPSNGTGILAVVWIWLHGVAYMFAWSGLLVAYTVEVLPFKLRAKGLTIMNVAVQVALVVNQYVNPLAIGEGSPWKNDGWKLYCIYTVWIFLELIWVYFGYPETRGPTLEEIAKIFDGDAAEVGTTGGKDMEGIRMDSAPQHGEEKRNAHAHENERV